MVEGEGTAGLGLLFNLQERLAAMPAVVVTGARQAGKSTAAREMTPGSSLAGPRGHGPGAASMSRSQKASLNDEPSREPLSPRRATTRSRLGTT